MPYLKKEIKQWNRWKEKRLLNLIFFCFEKDELENTQKSFIKCFIEYDGVIIGNERQPVLLGSLVLSFQDLFNRLQKAHIIQTLKFTDREAKSEEIDDSIRAIPNHIESFDGCIARLYSFNSLTFLLVKDEFSGAVIDIPLELSDYCNLIIKILRFLNDL